MDIEFPICKYLSCGDYPDQTEYFYRVEDDLTETEIGYDHSENTWSFSISKTNNNEILPDCLLKEIKSEVFCKKLKEIKAKLGKVWL